jgi:hypothetical protein
MIGQKIGVPLKLFLTVYSRLRRNGSWRGVVARLAFRSASVTLGGLVAFPLAAAVAGAQSDQCGDGKPCAIESFSFNGTDPLLPAMRETVLPRKKRAWEDSLGGQEAAKPQIRARLVGWPLRFLADKQRLPTDDRAFLERLARDTWRGLDALSDRDNGLPIDNIRLANGSVAVADAHIGDYTSSTNIGLSLIATVAAFDLQLITREQAVAKIRTTVATLKRLEAYHGLFYNFYDTTSLERTSNFVSFVDSSWLTAGLIVVRQAFPEVHDAASALIAQTDYSFFYNRERKLVSHGYYVNLHRRSPFDYGVLFTEARLGSLIAIGKGDIPRDVWFAMIRTFPSDCDGQTMTPMATTTKSIEGHEVAAGFYEWEGLRYVPSWGGSMFEALMPTLVLDELQYAPKSLGNNGRIHALVQQRYAGEQLGYAVWGMSPSATPDGNGYHEYGARVLGSFGYTGGSVTPHASALALAVTPESAVANLRALAARYDLYGDFGFYDAVDPRSGAVAHTYLALDQSMLLIAIANSLDHGAIPKRFASDPILQKVLPMIGAEDFFDGATSHQAAALSAR